MNCDDAVSVICTWPNGEKKSVMIASQDDEFALVFWNEQVVGCGSTSVIGCDELVPVSWLSGGVD